MEDAVGVALVVSDVEDVAEDGLVETGAGTEEGDADSDDVAPEPDAPEPDAPDSGVSVATSPL